MTEIAITISSKETEAKLEELKSSAKAQKIPIINDQGLTFLIDFCLKNNIKKILEIGSAIGYSAINLAIRGIFVDTFERNELLIEQLYRNIKAFNLTDMITVYPKDALFYESLNSEYDLIFIDAAKAQYQKFFLKYQNNLKEHGFILCDNIFFHNLDINSVSRQTRQLIRKINLFKDFLRQNSDFETTIYEVGDGISVSQKK